MISEVDIRDWNRKIDNAKSCLEDMDDCARMGPVTPIGAYDFLKTFIKDVENHFQSQQKQVAALFQPPKT